MSNPTTPRHPPSWIPPSFVWMTAADIFAIKVATSDPDVVEFIATGERWVDLHRSRAKAMLMANLLGAETLRGQLEAAAWTVLRHTEDWKKGFVKAKIHCHGVFLLPGGRELLVLVAANLPSKEGAWLPDQARAKARDLLAEHQTKVAEFDAHIERKKQENARLFSKSEQGQNVADTMLAMEAHHQRPVLTAEHLLPDLPKATTFQVAATPRASIVERSATKAIADSGWPSARDAAYTGLLGFPVGGRRMGLVTWEPYNGLPSYPEVRWAVQRRLPHALHKPRSVQVGRPELDSGTQPAEHTGVVAGLDVSGQDWPEFLEDLQLDQSEYRQRIDDIQRDKQAHGFEAIAWFQPYHAYAEDTWGIYFNARKLDDLALSLWDDFRSQRVHGSHGDAARLAFGLTYAHELFHARVEAALSWLEVNALQPRHLRYKQRVYDALRETPDWLEEALANWAAWDWLQSAPVQALFARRIANPESLQRIVESSLDLSPPGYRDWRVGHQPIAWRTFTTQLSTGQAKPSAQPIGLPLESTLLGPLPYDFGAGDIPLRFVGSGVIADRLHSHPATVNVPTRRELEKALKFFKHIVDPAGGKGSHQKWTGPDNRAFILPTRDPVSVGVFKTFLQYLGIDKATYVREVRPNL